MRQIFILLILVFSINSVQSQVVAPCSPTDDLAYDFCTDVCAICDIGLLNGYVGNTGTWSGDVFYAGEVFCVSGGVSGGVHNNGWVAFVATQTTLNLLFSFNNCTGGDANGNSGLQTALYETANCIDMIKVACHAELNANSYNLIANNLVVGHTYYLMMDGWANSICDFEIEVIEGAGNPTVLPSTPIGGPQSVCLSESTGYTFGPVSGAYYSTWVLPPGATILGENPATVILDDNAPTTVYIDFGPNPTSGQICVTPYNGCQVGNEVCLPVTIEPIQDTNLDPIAVCFGETYTWIDGVSYTNNNTAPFPNTITKQQLFGGGSSGVCDSTVIQDIIYLPSLVTNLPDIIACQGETIMVGSQAVTTTQVVSTTVTNYAGCDSTINVFVQFISNDAQANGPLAIGCTGNNPQLVGSGTTSNGTYAWYDPTDALVSNTLTATPSVSGDYYFVVTNTSGGTTCMDTAFAAVTADLALPLNVMATASGTIGCTANASATLTATSSTPGATFQWLDPSTNPIGGPGATTIVTQTGIYQVVATNPTSGCTATFDIEVLGDSSIPDITATGGAIDCDNPTATIVVTSTTSGVEYAWTGPSAYASTLPSNSVSNTGSYTIVITDPSNGCTNSTSVEVEDNTALPSVTASGNTVGCGSTGVTITAVSADATSFSWTGPNNYSSNMQNPADITMAGTYTVVVINSFGCNNSTIALVNADDNLPTVSPIGGTVSCTDLNVTVAANAAPSNVSYSWTGPNSFSSSAPTFSTSEPGTYTVVVTNDANQCTAEGTVLVGEDLTEPILSLLADAFTIDCNNPDVLLTATSDVNTFSWSGNGLNNTTSSVTVTQGGVYTVEVTGSNGCKTTESITIDEDSAQPDVTAADVNISCAVLNPMIVASSTVDPTTTYSWTGPNSFSADEASAEVTISGTYTVLLTNTENGCTNSTTIEVNDLVVVPNLTTTGSMLGCGNNSTQISASAPAGSSYSWTGPNNFAGTGSSVNVPVVGIYTVTITDANGCTASGTAEVLPDVSLPELTTIQSGLITCDNASSATFTASSSTPGVSYQWTGPGINSTDLSISVSDDQEYIVVVTAPNGCTNQAALTADVDMDVPELTNLNASNILNCTVQEATLSATTNAVSYQWTGPSSFSSVQAMPEVSVVGEYTVVVTGSNACTISDVVLVEEDLALPDVSASDGVVGCTNPTTILTATSSSNITNYSWSGPGGLDESTQAITVSNAGEYIVVVTGDNGCTQTATSTVTASSDLPEVSATGGILTCLNTSVDLMGSSITTGATGIWTQGQNPITSDFPYSASLPGDYTLTVTAPNGCTQELTVSVTESIEEPDVTALAPAELTCQATTISIYGNSNTPDVTFQWSGPNGYSSSTHNPNDISTEGIYILTVSAPNGCTKSATVEVTTDGDLPNVTALGHDLNCDIVEVTLTGSSMTSGVVYNWSGPGVTTPSSQNQLVTLPGIYTVEVTALNGCTQETTVTVGQDLTPPIITDAQGGTILCGSTSSTLMGSSSTMGATFTWIGPGGVEYNEANPTVDEVGTYTLVVTNPISKCTASQEVEVQEDINAPDGEVSVMGEVTCVNNEVQISGTSTTSGVTYTWTSPSNQTLDGAGPHTVSEEGDFKLLILAPNGCETIKNLAIPINKDEPGATINNITLGCGETGTLMATTNPKGTASYNWTGPSGYSSLMNEPNDISIAGTYTVIITDSNNGCTSTATTEVEANQDLPNVSASAPTELNCNMDPITIIGESTTQGVTSYVWSGPNGYMEPVQNPNNVLIPGTYTLTVTGPNGCTNSADVEVAVDGDLPNVNASAPTQLNCDMDPVTLEGSSSTPNVTGYVWSGPNGYTASVQSPNDVTEPGTYTLVVTAANGCINSADVEVQVDGDFPSLVAVGGELNCGSTGILITSMSLTSGVTYQWTGPGIGGTANQPNQFITVGGSYTVEVTATNGCVHDTTFVVEEDMDLPVITNAQGGTILCGTVSTTLIGESSTPGVSYAWVGPGNVEYTFQNPVVDEVGTYTLIVTDQTNECTATQEVQVLEDVNAPSGDVSVSGVITCANDNVQIEVTASVGNSYLWTSPSNQTIIGAGPHTVMEDGNFKLVITGANGCETIKNLAIPVNKTEPGASIEAIVLGCDDPIGTLSVTTNPIGMASYLWSGPNGFSSTMPAPNNITDEGSYTVVITDSDNGCSSSATTMVTSNQDLPDVFANDASIDCNNPTVTIIAGSATDGVTFEWTGPNGFSSTIDKPNVSKGGDYLLTVTDPTSGCTAQAISKIGEDFAEPTGVKATVSGIITCTDPSVTIEGSSLMSGMFYAWTGPNSFTANVQNPMVSDPGEYILTVQGPNGCTTEAAIIVEKDSEFPTIQTTIDDVLTCVKMEVAVHAEETSGKSLTYVWSGPNGFSASVADVMVSAPGIYTVEGTAANGCIVTTQAVVEINDTPPMAVAGGGFEIDCIITEGTLTAEGSAIGSSISYLWTTTQGHIVEGEDIKPNPLVDGPGLYELIVTDATNGCSATATVEVTVDPSIPSELDLQVRHVSCYGEKDGSALIVKVIGGQAPYQYTFNGSDVGIQTNFVDLGPGDYPITVIDANGCKLNSGVSITEPKLLTVDLGPDRLVEFGDEVKVEALVFDTKLIAMVGWNDYLDSTCLLTNPMECYLQQFIAERTTTFEVSITDTMGCLATDRMMVFVEKPRNVYFPNTFTPNGDGHNDIYTISFGRGVEHVNSFEIYDRWGTMISAVSNIPPGQNILVWDGAHKGKPVDPAVYVYRAEIRFKDGETESFMGDITLIR